ncbi:hypothetical protein C5O00_01145 [Pukyongia salina]|uniref:BNR repeat protein n=1 Tax=Pukyongia salina TaxID=2094025 RepID=A0A2S0HT81_9FLAO|nr:hypothetical protein [Pukyongia salina]AVI49845.1 hypothetical protein C5O00_01145 [Pukyongia salina]
MRNNNRLALDISKIVSYLLLLFLFSTLIIACKDSETKVGNTETKTSVVTQLPNPVEGNSSLPRIFSNGKEIYMSWVEKKDSLAILKYASYSNGSWSDYLEESSGSDWFVNWADFPVIAENNGNIVSSFLQKSATGTYTYDVKLNFFNSNTSFVKNNFLLHDDGTQSEHGFVSVRPYTGNSFLFTWLDGRETVGKGHGQGAMTLRAALLFEDGTIDYDTLMDDRVCDCCQTASAIGPDDEIIVAYRDRKEGEIRDISVVRWDKKDGWSEPLPIGDDQWKIDGCPVNGPAIDSFGNSLAVAWFTAVGGEGKVQLVFSNDVGRSYGKPIRIDSGNATGRVDVVMLNETEAAVMWMEPDGDEETIRVLKVTSEGKKGDPITISHTSAERASGFPQLERLGTELFTAWTVVNKGTSSIKTATLSLDKL